jgi:hypothetical protein
MPLRRNFLSADQRLDYISSAITCKNNCLLGSYGVQSGGDLSISYSQKVVGSRPNEVIFFNLPNPSSRTRPWGLLSLYQKSVPKVEKCFWGAQRGHVRLATLPPSVSQLFRQCAILNIQQPYRPPWPVNGTALLST